MTIAGRMPEFGLLFKKIALWFVLPWRLDGYPRIGQATSRKLKSAGIARPLNLAMLDPESPGFQDVVRKTGLAPETLKEWVGYRVSLTHNPKFHVFVWAPMVSATVGITLRLACRPTQEQPQNRQPLVAVTNSPDTNLQHFDIRVAGSLGIYAGDGAREGTSESLEALWQTSRKHVADPELASRIAEFAEIMVDDAASLEKKVIAQSTLAQVGEEVIPALVDFAEGLLPAEPVDHYDPNYISRMRAVPSVRAKLVDALFGVASRVGQSHPDKFSGCFRTLFSGYEKSAVEERKAFLSAFYLGQWPEDLQEQVASIVLKRNRIDLDPVTRTVIASLLVNERRAGRLSPETLLGADMQVDDALKNLMEYVDRKTGSERASELAQVVESVGCGNMVNAAVFAYHVQNLLYSCTVEQDPEDGVYSLLWPQIGARLRPFNSVYLYGFDFYGIRVCHFEINDVLLGKSRFRRSAPTWCHFTNTALLDCDFADARISFSEFSGVRWLYDDVSDVNLTGCALIKSAFAKCKLAGSTFSHCCILDCNMTDCYLRDLSIHGSVVIGTSVSGDEAMEADFCDALVDENTLDSLRANPSLGKGIKSVDKIQVPHLEKPKPDVEGTYGYNIYFADPNDDAIKVLLISCLSAAIEAGADVPWCKSLVEGLCTRPIYLLNRGERVAAEPSPKKFFVAIQPRAEFIGRPLNEHRAPTELNEH